MACPNCGAPLDWDVLYIPEEDELYEYPVCNVCNKPLPEDEP